MGLPPLSRPFAVAACSGGPADRRNLNASSTLLTTSTHRSHHHTARNKQPTNDEQAHNPRAMKNAEKLAASTKKPRYPVYEEGGRIVWIRPGMEELIFGGSGAAAAEAAAAAAQAE